MRWVIEYNEMAKLQEQFPVLLKVMDSDMTNKRFPEKMLVNGHEETPDVQFQYPPFPLVIS